MSFRLLTTCVLGLLLAACGKPEEAPEAATVQVASPEEGGAVSTAPVQVDPVPADAAEPEPDPVAEEGIDWSPLELKSGQVSASCDLDYVGQGDGTVLTEFGHEALVAALQDCAERGVLRLRYVGKINGDFAAMMQRTTRIADELGIGKRILDIDSSGGMVEDAIRAGDRIAESRWTVWVREGAVCHSACVFILGAGDVRMISGRVGIHRIIRMSSTATTRVELNRELRAVYDRVRDYLERNGAATAVADMMMAVPNRNLRLLTSEELSLYGLDGINPAQDDLDRLRLMRKCGEDFVARRDAFVRAFDARCKAPDAELDALNTCGLDLRKTFGFPDATCPTESPLSEFDTQVASGVADPADGVDVPAQAEEAPPPPRVLPEQARQAHGHLTPLAAGGVTGDR